MRLDLFISERFSLIRNRARQLIEASLVSVNDRIITKVSFVTNETDHVILLDDKRIHWVSRSAKKLDDFLMIHPNISIEGTDCLDVGASTGGFTQVLLERCARHVDAVDVGHDQLHPKIRDDVRVSSYERTDIRDFLQKNPQTYDVIVSDVSFISLEHIFGAIRNAMKQDTVCILLFKPQFEVGRSNLRKNGTPKTLESIEIARRNFEQYLLSENIEIQDVQESTLPGEAGNREWIYLLVRAKESLRSDFL